MTLHQGNGRDRGLGKMHSHEHGHEQPKYPYVAIMNKPFPWKEKDCNLFDLDCKAKFRAATR